MKMKITRCTKADYDEIIRDIVDFWDSDRTLPLHGPIFITEFVNSAFVCKSGKRVAGYLFGFLSQAGPVGYIHLLGVRQTYRRKGVARLLYNYFTDFAKKNGCTELKAITSPTNKASIAFHKSIGMEPIGEPNEEGIPVVKNYSGAGLDRVVFKKKI